VNDTKNTVTSHEIASILVKRKLSNKSILLDPDHERRARDHAMNCVLLGLLRHNAKDSTKYEPTTVSADLRRYSFSDSCPKDLHETAFFADRLCRLKLDNAQLRGETYTGFRVRPLVNMLRILSSKPLHIYQIHYLLSANEDFVMDPWTESSMRRKVEPYDATKDPDGTKFFKKFIKTDLEYDEAFRSTKPLLDWCYQAGLVYCDQNYWYRISQKGLMALEYHKRLKPVWYEDFVFDPDAHSALLLVLNAAYSVRKAVDLSALSSYEKGIVRELRDIVEFKMGGDQLKYGVAFELDSDVPASRRASIESQAKKALAKSNLANVSLSLPSMQSIAELEEAFSKTSEEREVQDKMNMLTALGISMPRVEAFQTEFEWQSCIRLRVLGYNADAYNGEFAGACDLRMASDNPDAVIKNSFLSLVECKSEAEWGPQLKLGKTAIGAFAAYQEYAEEVSANSALFVCESRQLDEDRYMDKFYQSRSLDKLVIVNFDTLVSLRKNTPLKMRFDKAIRSPESYSLRDRVFYN
jgi:hypothetical protein